MILMHQFVYCFLASSVLSAQIRLNNKKDLKPIYNIDKNNANDAKSYANLFVGLQKVPILASPYLNTGILPYVVPPLSWYSSQNGAPGYPASTWPLETKDAPASPDESEGEKLEPYTGGDKASPYIFGFGGLKNKILPASDLCPKGYAKMFGDIPGWGTSLGSKIMATRQECADRCTQHPDCLSFEHSNTEFLCNLNTVEQPSVKQYRDYIFCSKIQILDSEGNRVDQIPQQPIVPLLQQPIVPLPQQPIVPSGGTIKIINDKIEKLQQDRFDSSNVLTNMTLCYFVGDDILNSHLMFNDRWHFTPGVNTTGLKTYINDITFGANLHLGRRNFLLKWRGPFRRSDASDRYPGQMEKDTKRASEMGVCDAVVFIVFNDFKAQLTTDGHQFSGFVKGAPCETEHGTGYIVMVDQGFWGMEWTGPQILAHQLLRLLTADVCAGIKQYDQETIHWNTNCFCQNEDSLLHPYLKPGEQYLDQCVIDKLNKSDISLRECLRPDHN